MPYWFDPLSLALVLVGSAVITLLRCGWAETSAALGSALGLLRRSFDPIEAKAEMAKQVREIADDGYVRAEAHHIGDGEFDSLADLLLSRRSIDALLSEHDLYKHRRARAAARASRVFEAAAEAGPVMGLAGTLIALAAQRGSGSGDLVAAVGMAVLTTLYGLLAANLLYGPIATAILRRNEREEADRDAVLAWLDKGLQKLRSNSIDDRPLARREAA